jgi:hypothetical protein
MHVCRCLWTIYFGHFQGQSAAYGWICKTLVISPEDCLSHRYLINDPSQTMLTWLNYPILCYQKQFWVVHNLVCWLC